MNEKVKSFLIYAAKCATGTLAVYILASLLHYNDISWPLISVMLVLSADGKDSLTLAITRVKANVVGAAVGALCLFISPANMWLLSMALAGTLGLCYIFKLEAGIRSSLAATIIIMLHPEGHPVWETALQRIIAVLAGCLLALLITVIFHFKTKPVLEELKNIQQDA